MIKPGFISSFFLLVHFFAFSHVELNYPEGGNVFYTNDTVTIKWTEEQAHNTQNWELYFSSDGGDTWTEISNSIPVAAREFNWIVPAVETTKGRIRVVQNNEEEDYDDVSANFTIEKAQSTSEINQLVAHFDIYPNPVNTFFNCSVGIKRSTNVEIFLSDIRGRTIQQLEKKSLTPGKHTFLFNTADLKNGSYLVQMSIEGVVLTRKIYVVK